VGYQFTSKFQAGAGVTYNYYADKRYATTFSKNIFGINSYAEFRPLPADLGILSMFFLRAEYALMHYNTNNHPSLDVNMEWVSYPLVGGGAALPLGNNGAITMSILWNLNHSDKSLYENPIYRVGVNFGL
jgi:hypothetical protein